MQAARQGWGGPVAVPDHPLGGDGMRHHQASRSPVFMGCDLPAVGREACVANPPWVAGLTLCLLERPPSLALFALLVLAHERLLAVLAPRGGALRWITSR